MIVKHISYNLLKFYFKYINAYKFFYFEAFSTEHYLPDQIMWNQKKNEVPSIHTNYVKSKGKKK